MDTLSLSSSKSAERHLFRMLLWKKKKTAFIGGNSHPLT